MAAAKKQTKKDLENRIAELEAKLNKLAAKLESKPAEAPKPEPPKPAETKPAEAPKPEPPKPAETTTQPPATFQEALENAYYNSTMTDTHQYKAKTPGYAPAPNRYFVRLTAPVGKVPTSNWNDQKAKVTGYTQPSNQYFATRARMAYHPPDKTFGGFSGATMSVEGVEIQAPPPEPPKPAETTTQQAPPPQQSSSSSNTGKSKQQVLEEYEAEYLNKMAKEQKEYEELMSAAAELKAKRQTEAQPSDSQSKKGSLPKGF